MPIQKTSEITAYVIVCWNNIDIIDECLTSIQKQTYKDRLIVVVDNGSTDGSVPHVRKSFPDVVVIETGNNNGFSIGTNIGIRYAMQHLSCRYIALINSDARIAENWTETLVSFSRQHPHVASLQTPTVDYYDHAIYDSFGITLDRLGRGTQIGYRTAKGPTRNQRVFGVNFAAALVTREFLEFQPFEDYLDEDIWMYADDVDFAARATIMGWENWLVTGSEAYHMGSASSSKNPGFSIFMTYRNNLYLIIKNFSGVIFWKLLIGLLISDAKSYVQLARGKNTLAIKSMLKGRLVSILHCGTFIKKRRYVSQHRTITNRELWDLMDPNQFSMNEQDT